MSEEKINISFQDKIKFFFEKNSKSFIILIILLIFTLFSYFFYIDSQKKKEMKISGDYTQATLLFKEKKIDGAKQLLEEIILKKHKFYSPLALYFIIDNNLETNSLKIINFYDEILSIGSINKENLNLIKIKKTIYLLNLGKEDLIIKTINPIVNSDSVWRNMAIKLVSDYFLSTGQESKAKEYIQLLNNKIEE